MRSDRKPTMKTLSLLAIFSISALGVPAIAQAPPAKANDSAQPTTIRLVRRGKVGDLYQTIHRSQDKTQTNVSSDGAPMNQSTETSTESKTLAYRVTAVDAKQNLTVEEQSRDEQIAKTKDGKPQPATPKKIHWRDVIAPDGKRLSRVALPGNTDAGASQDKGVTPEFTFPAKSLRV